MMKKVSFLTKPVLILALFALSCSQGTPTDSNEDEVVPQIDAPAVSSVDEVGPQLTPVVVGNSSGRCCPEGFDFEAGFEHPANRNGDGVVCKKVTTGGTITIDNTTPGDCCFPPDPCGGGGD